MKTISFLSAAAVAVLLLFPVLIHAQDIQTKTIKLAAGKSSASVNGSITGYQIIDYVIGASAGQTLKVSLKTNKASNYFNILPPGSNDVAVYNSSINGNKYTGTLEQSGNYKIRVYLERADARRNVKATYTLTVGITGAIAAGDAKVPGTNFNATGEVQAALVPTAKLGSSMASFGVVRHGNGDADIHLTNANNEKRIIKYSKGEFQCISPAGGKLTYTREGGDNWKVTLNGKETYLIPDAVITGG